MKSFIRKHAWMKAGLTVGLFLEFALWGMSQAVTVTGTVNDETGEPLAGVNIRIEGTTTGTITDADGAYSINVPGAQSVLQFNYIGYASQSITAGNRNIINVVMLEDVAELEEVIVIGYGTVRKSDVTGSVSRVTERTIKERPVQNAVQALQGKASGVDITSNTRPGEVGEIRIRGNRSIDASNDPLYVIDGIPMISGTISDINPNDIASIEILKDASATAIYGSRGANGVVLVSTKKGAKGRTSIDYDGTVTFSKIHPMTDWMNAGELLDWQRQRYLNGGTYAGAYGTAPDPARDYTLFMESLNYMRPILGTAYQLTDNDPSKPVLRQATPDEIARGYADQVPVYNAANLFDQNWTDLVVRTGVVQNHQISLSSGSDNSKLYMSVGYLNQQSPMKDQDYNRYNFNLNGEITPRKWLTAGLSANGAYNIQNRGLENGNSNAGNKDSYGQAQSLLPYAPAYDETGAVFRPAAVDGISYDNIVNNMANANYEIRQYSIMANSFAEIRFVPWLRYRMNFGSQYRNHRTGYYYGPGFSNPFGARPIASAAGTGRNHTRSYFSWIVENLLYADKTWGAHTLGATLLQSAQRVHDEEIHLRAQNLIFPSSLWYSLQQNATSTPYDYGTSMTETQLMSYMARLNYSLSNKYLLTVTGRWDGASVLAEGHKWDFFPSTALAWKMEEEEWIKNIDVINQLKLRVGYGVTGNAAVSAYSTTGGINSAYYYFDKSVSAGYKSNVMPNPQLGWEKTSQWNAGLDYSLLRGRISGSIELYKANTDDLLLYRTLPATIGYTQVRANIGKTQNKGLEVTVSSVNIDQKDFRWTMDVNVSINREKIVELASGVKEDVTNGWFVGQPINVFYDYKYDRLWQDTPEDQRLMALYKTISNYNYQPGQTKVVDQPLNIDNSKKGADGWKTVTVNGEEFTYEDNGFGVIAATTDRYILGTSRPKWVGGLTNTFAYKNWELSAFLYARVGNMYYGALQTFGRRVENSVWSPDNPGAKFYQPTSTPGLTDHNSTRNYTSGTMFYLRNISLSYTVPQNLLKRWDIGRAQIYAQVLNPFIWGGEAVQLGLNPDDLTGWRVRTQTATGDSGIGQTNNTMQIRSFVVGLRLGF
ncbi:MAG: TonB-dependent receptor [Tannerella sp.]|jgi:TonB-linked SusC/RagA family outer membrane protein|nr:TonB-dependent receptor [Tannerella sp.]